MKYELEFRFFDGRTWANARRDLAIVGTIHDAMRAAQKLFKDAAGEPKIPFLCRVVESESGKLVAVVGAVRGSGEVLTVMHEQYRQTHCH